MKNSDVEFIEALNEIYEKAGSLNLVHRGAIDVFKFSRAYPDEYLYADTENGANPKLAAHAALGSDHPNFLGKFILYMSIALGPSGANQPRSIFLNSPNGFGFRRAGVYEWLEPMQGELRLATGGSWGDLSPEESAISGYLGLLHPANLSSNFGTSRLVRTHVEVK